VTATAREQAEGALGRVVVAHTALEGACGKLTDLIENMSSEPSSIGVVEEWLRRRDWKEIEQLRLSTGWDRKPPSEAVRDLLLMALHAES
jgi:hypothetical protein